MPKDKSFLPEDYLEKRIARRTNVICISLFVVVLAGTVAAFVVGGQQSREIAKQAADINSRFEEAARRLEQLEQLQEQKQQMLRKAKVTSVLVERVPRSRLLAELSNHMPSTLSLLEFELDTKVLRRSARPKTNLDKAKSKSRAAAQAKDAGPSVSVPETEVSLMMIGVAPTDVELAQYMTKLSSHPLFDHVHLQFSEETDIEDREMRKFRINMVLNQDLNLDQYEPTLVRRGLEQNPMSDKIQIDETGQLISPTASITEVPTNTQGD